MKLSSSKLKMTLFFILIVVLLFTYGWPWATTNQLGSSNANITIAFHGAGKGLDPQGNRFDINEIKSDRILEEAIAVSGMEETLTADELKRRIYILPQADQDTLKELLTLTTISGKTQDIKERIVYPTSFTIGLKDMGIPSYFSDRKLLGNILKIYEKQLKSKYLSDTLGDPAYNKEEILKMDYPEMMKVLNQEAESLLLYINSYASNEPQFTSTKTNLSFSDVSQKAALLKDTDIGSMRSLVDYYELTEDSQSRILYEETMLKRAGVVSSKLQGAQLTTAEITQIYDNSSNYIFASGQAGTANLEPLENQFYGDLINALVDKQTSYISAKYDQQDIQQAISKLQAGSITGIAYNTLTNEIKSGTKTALDRMEELRTQTQQMAEEFYESNIGNKIYTSKLHYDIHSNGNILINFVVLTVVCFLINMIYLDLKRSNYSRYLEMIVEPFRRMRHGK